MLFCRTSYYIGISMLLPLTFIVILIRNPISCHFFPFVLKSDFTFLCNFGEQPEVGVLKYVRIKLLLML